MAFSLALVSGAIVFYATCFALDRVLTHRAARRPDPRQALRETKEYEASVHYISQIDDELMRLLKNS